MNKIIAALQMLLIVFVCRNGYCQSGPSRQLVLPTRSQVEWADAEIGVLIHYDINLFSPDSFDYKKKETLPDLKVFNPSRLNTDQWIESAKKGGARYAVLVAKHGTGFTLWPSKVHGYHVGNTPWKNGNGDIVKDFVRSCKKYNIRPGIYYNTNYNTYLNAGYNGPKTPSDQKKYNEAVLEQLTELWSNYGDLFEIWFDGGVMTDDKGGIASQVVALIKKHQPKAILFQGPVQCGNLIRWIGNEKGRSPYPLWSTANSSTSETGVTEVRDLHGDPDGKLWCPGEADFPLRKDSAQLGGFMWNKNSEGLLLSADELVDRYYTSAGQNSNVLLGMVIDTSGVFPKEDSVVFEAFGKKINRLLGHPLGQTSGNGNSLILNISSLPITINTVMIMEDISKGERIRRYTVEALIDDQWKKICDGSAVGHKRLQKFDPVKTSRLRLTIPESVSKPVIKKFAAFIVQ